MSGARRTGGSALVLGCVARTGCLGGGVGAAWLPHAATANPNALSEMMANMRPILFNITRPRQHATRCRLIRASGGAFKRAARGLQPRPACFKRPSPGNAEVLFLLVVRPCLACLRAGWASRDERSCAAGIGPVESQRICCCLRVGTARADLVEGSPRLDGRVPGNTPKRQGAAGATKAPASREVLVSLVLGAPRPFESADR